MDRPSTADGPDERLMLFCGGSAGEIEEGQEGAGNVGMVGGGGCLADGVHGPDGSSHVDATEVDL